MESEGEISVRTRSFHRKFIKIREYNLHDYEEKKKHCESQEKSVQKLYDRKIVYRLTSVGKTPHHHAMKIH